MNNLESYIKDEYVIMHSEYFSAGNRHYVYNENDNVMPRNLPYRKNYGTGTKYSSKKEAEGKLNELISKGFFGTDNVVEGENLAKSIVKAWFDNDFKKKKAVAVVKLPVSYYLGNYGAYAYNIGKQNIPYDNGHRYQCASHRDNVDGKSRWLYAKVIGGNTVEWVESQAQATCMTAEEQKEWCDKLNKEKPYKGHVQEMNLPVILEKPQKYHVGDKVIIFRNGACFHSTVVDVMAQEDGKYHYALSSACGILTCMNCEGFYCGADLYEEERIMPFTETAVSYEERKAGYDTYYENVVMPDGRKIEKIKPL